MSGKYNKYSFQDRGYDNTPYTDRRKKHKSFNEDRRYNDYSFRDRGHNNQGRSYNNRRDTRYRYNRDFEPSDRLKGIFLKKFEFRDNDENPISTPPSVDDIFNSSPYSIDSLMEEKDGLNKTRSELDHFDITKWSKHTSFTDRSSKIVMSIRRKIRPEMCTIAWAKMYEILSTYPNLIPFDDGKLHSVHICEAPGAFICSTNHYVQTKRKYIDWNWTGNSLNPHFEGNDLQSMIDDDRLINETIDHWHFGKDNSGNIMNIENIRDLWSHCKDLPVFLVTSDGSVDCQHVPNEQEHYTAPLHYCEMVCALGLLKKGGGFVIKLFNLFEHSTAGMLYFLKAHFDELHVFKPVTSKSGNSETYAIAIGFKGIKDTLLERLLSYVQYEGNIFDEFCLIPKEKMSINFIDQFCECSIKFADFQHKAIRENIELWNDGIGISYERKQTINDEKEWVSNEWFEHYPISRLDSRYFISSAHLSGDRLSRGRSLNPDNIKLSGSLQERQNAIQERVNISTGTSIPQTPLNERDNNSNTYSDFAQLQMAQMMGIDVNDLDIDSKEDNFSVKDRQGLGFQSTNEDYKYIWTKGLIFDTESYGYMNDFEQYKITSGSKLKEVKYSKFCKDDILIKYKGGQNLLRSKFISPSQLIEAGQKAKFPYFIIQNEIFQGYPHVDSVKFHEVLSITSTRYISSVVLCGSNEHVRKSIENEKEKLKFKDLYILEDDQKKPYHHSLSIIHDIKEKIGSVGLFIGDLSWPEELFFFPTSENEFHLSVLKEMFIAISTLSPGGSLILRFGNCLTRYSCNILYFLYRLFDTLLIMKPVFSSPVTNERIIVAKDFKGRGHKTEYMMNRIEEVLKKTSELNDGEVIYDFIHPSVLSEPHFFKFILEANCQLLMREVEAIYALVDSIEYEEISTNTQKSMIDDIFENINLKLKDIQ